MIDDILSVLTLNVRGLNDQQQRPKKIRWIQKNQADINFIQETKLTTVPFGVPKSSFFTTNEHPSRGVAAIWNNKHEILKNERVDENLMYTEIQVKDTHIIVINAYIQCESAVKRNQFIQIEELYEELVNQTPYIFLVGDFNTNLDGRNLDARSLECTLEKLNLIDLYRHCHPEGKNYSWCTTDLSRKSRIDYIFGPARCLSWINKIEITTTPHFVSDHNFIKIELKVFNDFERGAGYWKLNSSILADKLTLEDLTKVLQREIEKKPEDPWRLACWWSLLKSKIKKLLIQKSQEAAKKRKNEERDVLKKIQEAEEEAQIFGQDIEITERIITLKKQYDEIEKKKIEALIIKTKKKWIDLEERTNSFFLSQLNDHQRVHDITAIKNKQGQVYHNKKEVLDTVKSYYEELWASNTTNQDFNYWTNFLPKNAIRNNTIEAHISESDIEEVLKITGKNKSPGPDGIPYELYAALPKIFTPILKEIFMQAMTNQSNGKWRLRNNYVKRNQNNNQNNNIKETEVVNKEL